VVSRKRVLDLTGVVERREVRLPRGTRRRLVFSPGPKRDMVPLPATWPR